MLILAAELAYINSNKKGKKFPDRIEKIQSTMVLHKNMYGSETRFYTMSGISVNNFL